MTYYFKTLMQHTKHKKVVLYKSDSPHLTIGMKLYIKYPGESDWTVCYLLIPKNLVPISYDEMFLECL